MGLTPEDRAKGPAAAAKALGPAGCSVRARKAAMARWGTVKPKKPKLCPPLGLLLAWLEIAIEDYDDRPGYALQRGRLAELVAWVRAARRDRVQS
jgi:hypothetical protein